MIRRTLWIALILCAGCTTRKPAPPASTPPPKPVKPASIWIGRVLRVNAEQRYVIVECALLPRAGEEATVIRNETLVGRVRFARQISFPYAAADVLEGEIVPGDRIKK